MFGVNIIKCFYNWPAQLLRDPTALDHPIFDSGDKSVTLLRIVVPGIDDNHVIRRSSEQIAREVRNVLLRNSYDYDFATSGCLVDSDGRSAGLFRKIGESFGAPRVGHEYFMTERTETPSQIAANISCTNNPYVHFLLLILNTKNLKLVTSECFDFAFLL